jgi:hypothetical protein
MACRKGVAVIDMSSFTKFELKVTRSYAAPFFVPLQNFQDFLDSIKKICLSCFLSLNQIHSNIEFYFFENKSAGREVVDFLQYMCCNDIDKPVGNVVHTG